MKDIVKNFKVYFIYLFFVINHIFGLCILKFLFYIYIYRITPFIFYKFSGPIYTDKSTISVYSIVCLLTSLATKSIFPFSSVSVSPLINSNKLQIEKSIQSRPDKSGDRWIGGLLDWCGSYVSISWAIQRRSIGACGRCNQKRQTAPTLAAPLKVRSPQLEPDMFCNSTSRPAISFSIDSPDDDDDASVRISGICRATATCCSEFVL